MATAVERHPAFAATETKARLSRKAWDQISGGFAGQAVDTGTEAEAYSRYIGRHVTEIGGGKTYAELGPVQFGLGRDRNGAAGWRHRSGEGARG